ncbi:DUF2812 domain-containing protein [Mesobacillus subterraneus]|uniref:DUF2812 domain-containing protein n=1 Tax=Mesobacillus subterraneus TaxID=285983 RepID=UPI001CFE4D36|nr:DUF2812 domain-containing protein [Mesobacillus subterraneus]WLR57288.1 DUF2812 domain-containing protein [Mesobacillus subterraneus]
MNKTIYKLRPSDFWRIGEHESWFADLAAEGLFLRKMGIHFAKFEKGEPKNMRYRIEVSISKKISADQIEMYSETGWAYVTSYGSFHVFSSPAELEAPELHTDPAEQSYTLKELDRKLAFNSGAVIIGMILMIGMLGSIWFLDGTPTLVLVDGIAVQQTILAIFLAYTAYNSLQATLSIRDLRKRLAEGIPIDHHASWKKKHTLHTTVAFVFTVLVGLSAIIPFFQLMKMDTKTLPEKNVDLPIVRLADVENNPDLVRAESAYLDDGVDWGNRYSYDWSPLAPVQYEADETGLVPGKLWDDKSGEYSPGISTQYYQLRIPSMADNLISDLIERYRYEHTQAEYEEKNHPDLDHLVVRVEDSMNEVYASKGNAVMYVRYFVYADVDLVIENVAKKITIIPD